MSAQPAYPAPLTAQRGGHPSASLTVTKPARDLHIPAAVLAHPGLSLLACAVLAEVLDLHQAKGHVFASDEHFAERCRAKPRTVRETIAELEAAGFLTREVNYAARHKRRLTPTDLWQNPPVVVAESATTTPPVVADSAGSSGEIRRDLWRNLPGVVADSANINTSLNTSTNTNLKNPSPAADAAAGGDEKKIGVVGPFQTDSPAIAAHTGGAADVATSIGGPKPTPAAKPKPARPVLMAQSAVAAYADFAAAWAAAADANPATYADFAGADLKHYHAALLDWSEANRKTKYDWLATIRNSMRRDLDAGKFHRLGQGPAPLTHASTGKALSPAQRQHHPPVVHDYGTL